MKRVSVLEKQLQEPLARVRRDLKEREVLCRVYGEMSVS